MSSGSAALEIALRVTDVAEELVAIPAFACASIERAVIRAGGRPYLVDADPDDLSFPRGAFRSLAGRCKAAILIHQFGLPAVAAEEAADLPMTVIEDATTCVGGRLDGQAVGVIRALCRHVFLGNQDAVRRRGRRRRGIRRGH